MMASEFSFTPKAVGVQTIFYEIENHSLSVLRTVHHLSVTEIYCNGVDHVGEQVPQNLERGTVPLPQILS